MGDDHRTSVAAIRAFRVTRSGWNVIYTGKVCKDGAAEFQKIAYDAAVEARTDYWRKLAAYHKEPAATAAAPHAAATGGKSAGGGAHGRVRQQDGSGRGANPSAPGSGGGSGPGEGSPPGGAAGGGAVPGEGSSGDGGGGAVGDSAPSAKVGGFPVDAAAGLVPGGAANAAGPVASEKTTDRSPSVAKPKTTDATAGSAAAGGGGGGSVSAANARQDNVSSKGPPPAPATLRFHFTSGGGDVASGIAMMDTLQDINGMDLRPPPALAHTIYGPSANARGSGSEASGSAAPPSAGPANGGTAPSERTSGGASDGAGERNAQKNESVNNGKEPITLDTECLSKGFVASAATYPAFACKKRIGSRHTYFLLHPPTKSGCGGQTDDLQLAVDNLQLVKDISTSILEAAARSRPAENFLADDASTAAGSRGHDTSHHKYLAATTNGVDGNNTADALGTGGVRKGWTGAADGGVKKSERPDQENARELQKRKLHEVCNDNRYSTAAEMYRWGLLDAILA
eukprot:gene123-116_t